MYRYIWLNLRNLTFLITFLCLNLSSNFFLIEEEEEFDESSQKNELPNVIKTLTEKLADMRTGIDLINKRALYLQKSLSELESLDSTVDISTKVKHVHEKATLFRIASTALVNVSKEFQVVPKKIL